jgi:dihydroneopterin aldolase
LITIQLANLKFFSFHGIYEEEKILGNNFEVSVDISLETEENITTMQQTINYASVYEIIKQRMAIPTALLETLAQDLALKIYEYDNRIKSITVTVEKKNPPISNMQGSVCVSFKKDF